MRDATMPVPFSTLLREARACTLCEPGLPLGARPIVQLHPGARLLIASQAPGRLAHESGIPFDDPSGERLRDWLGLDRERFYDPKILAVLPMGFCFPGTGKSGDLPPRSECAPKWRQPFLDRLKSLRWTFVIGTYAQSWHLGNRKRTLTETVRAFEEWSAQGLMPLPHPSPRNNIWLKKNPWFESEVLPVVRERVREAVEGRTD